MQRSDEIVSKDGVKLIKTTLYGTFSVFENNRFCRIRVQLTSPERFGGAAGTGYRCLLVAMVRFCAPL